MLSAHLSKAPFVLIGAPIDSIGGAGGTELSPASLRANGNWARVTVADRGDLDIRIRDRVRDPKTGIIGGADVIRTTELLRREIAHCLQEGHRPVLLGGCCTQVVGAVAGARDVMGRVGIAYLDGHLDLYDGVTSPTGEAADMPLAAMLGRGDQSWIDAAGGASLRPEDIALLGPRDVEDAASRGSLLPEDFTPAIPLWTNLDIAAEGPSSVAHAVANGFEEAARPFWLAIDVDIVDQAAFPATDYLMPGGLSWEAFASLVKGLARSPQLLGISLACYNPEKDEGLRDGKRLAELVIQALETKPLEDHAS
ncbi:arginase family protein [Dongia rigui]|uniref:Arginase family protein n=1 Tax=Dongia rigui TaxID=940149 RepID=A0ABU5E5L0_9PROT|nr:arginase family protein [Dongia rigui]MDY0874233.1 arginase family protein [Dongia rigui]